MEESNSIQGELGPFLTQALEDVDQALVLMRKSTPLSDNLVLVYQKLVSAKQRIYAAIPGSKPLTVWNLTEIPDIGPIDPRLGEL